MERAVMPASLSTQGSVSSASSQTATTKLLSGGVLKSKALYGLKNQNPFAESDPLAH